MSNYLQSSPSSKRLCLNSLPAHYSELSCCAERDLLREHHDDCRELRERHGGFHELHVRYCVVVQSVKINKVVRLGAYLKAYAHFRPLNLSEALDLQNQTYEKRDEFQ